MHFIHKMFKFFILKKNPESRAGSRIIFLGIFEIRDFFGISPSGSRPGIGQEKKSRLGIPEMRFCRPLVFNPKNFYFISYCLEGGIFRHLN